LDRGILIGEAEKELGAMLHLAGQHGAFATMLRRESRRLPVEEALT